MDPSWSWYLKVVDLFDSPGIAAAIWAWGWSVIGAVSCPRWCGGEGTSLCYGYVNSMTSIWPLAKKSPSERFWFQSWVLFRVLNHFFLIFTPVFGRKTFKVGIVVDYFVKPFFSRFCWWFLFPEKKQAGLFLFSQHKTAPHWWFSNGVLPNKRQNTWPTKRNIAGTCTSNEDFPENCATGIFQQSPC